MKMTDEQTVGGQDGVVLTPYELRVLMHYLFNLTTPCPGFQDVAQEARKKLEKLGFLKVSDAQLWATEKSRVWLDCALKTPLPVECWALPDGKVVAKKEGVC